MKRKSKKILALLLSVTMIGGIVTSCSNNKYKDLGNEYVHGVDLDMSFDNPSRDRFLASDEDTYYFLGLDGNRFLTAIDKNTGKYSVLCNKPNCLHHKETDYNKRLECNAFLESMIPNIFYFNDKIYFVGQTIKPKDYNTPNFSVYEVNTDGSGYKEIISFKEFPYAKIIHRGYLYVSFTDYMQDPDSYTEEKKKDLKYGVYRYDLSNLSKEREVIFEEKGKYGEVSYLTAIGEKIYMNNNNEEEENTMVYDIKKEKIYEREEDYRYTVRQDDRLLNLKYQDTTIKVTDFNDNIIDEIPIEKTGVLYCNDEIIAIDNINEYSKQRNNGDKEAKKIVTFYDKEGNKIQEVNINNDIWPVLGINENYLFFYSDDLENRTMGDLCVLDLSKLGTEEFKPEVYVKDEKTQLQ